MAKNSLFPAKKLLLFLALVLLAWGAIYLYKSESDQGGRGPARDQAIVGVNTALVERRDLVETRVFSGTLISEKRYDAAVKISGRVREIAVNLGDCIYKGELIARLDSEEYEQQLAQARAEIDVAQASLAQARSSLVAAERAYQRALKLRDQQVASAAELETAETERLARQAGVSLAQAQIKQRQAALRAAEVRLSYTTLTADWQNGDGSCRFVARRHVDEGDTIGANTPVVTLVDLSVLTAVIDVAERDYAYLHAGQPATIIVDYLADRRFAGTVARLAPVFDETSRQARVEITVANPDHLLKAGMFTRVHIELGRAEQTLAVPSTAVIERLGVTGAFVIDNGTAHFVPVTTGIADDGWVQVEGLADGQQVVTLGHHLLSDGVPVSTSDDADEVPQQASE